MRAPPACSDSRVASVIGVARPAYVVSNRESSAVNVGSAIASVYATPNSSSAATRASGTNRPPKGPKWPLASGSLGAITEQAYGAQTAPRLLPVPQGRVRPCCDKVGDRLARILVGDQPFANEHRVGGRRRGARWRRAGHRQGSAPGGRRPCHSRGAPGPAARAVSVARFAPHKLVR